MKVILLRSIFCLSKKVFKIGENTLSFSICIYVQYTFSFRDLSDIPYELEVRSMKMIMSKRPTDAGYVACEEVISI